MTGNEPLSEVERLRRDIEAVIREISGAPSIILYDGKPYKVIPTELADRLEREYAVVSQVK